MLPLIGSFVHISYNNREHPEIWALYAVTLKPMDSFGTMVKDSKGFENSYICYEEYPLEKLYSFSLLTKIIQFALTMIMIIMIIRTIINYDIEWRWMGFRKMLPGLSYYTNHKIPWNSIVQVHRCIIHVVDWNMENYLSQFLYTRSMAKVWSMKIPGNICPLKH